MQIVKTPKLVQKIFPSICWKKETNAREIYLTFDDSPTPKFTSWILRLLNSLSLKATFFCVGKKSLEYPSVISEIIKEGHQIGNHSYSHKNGFLSTTKSYLEDIEKCKTALPYTSLFRPPYGKIYPWQIMRLRKEYKIIMWDILSYDFKSNMTKKKLKSNVLENVGNGSIIVFHDNKKSEKILKDSLKEILIELKNKGFEFKLLCSDAKEV